MKVLVWDNRREVGYVVSATYPKGVYFEGLANKPVITGVDFFNIIYDTDEGLIINDASPTTLQATIDAVVAYIDAHTQPSGQSEGYTIDQLKDHKKSEMESIFNNEIRKLTTGIPANELAQWDAQYAEAKMFLADTTLLDADTPILTALVDGRDQVNEWRTAVATAIVAKVDTHNASVALNVGKYQKAMIRLDSAVTEDDILAVYWSPFG